MKTASGVHFWKRDLGRDCYVSVAWDLKYWSLTLLSVHRGGVDTRWQAGIFLGPISVVLTKMRPPTPPPTRAPESMETDYVVEAFYVAKDKAESDAVGEAMGAVVMHFKVDDNRKGFAIVNALQMPRALVAMKKQGFRLQTLLYAMSGQPVETTSPENAAEIERMLKTMMGQG